MPVTMQYQVEYEICSLFFLLIITVRFFSIRRFPNRHNHLFGIILICAIADLLLDVVGSYTIMNAGVVPPFINYALNTVFYTLQVVFPALMTTYVIYASGRCYSNNHGLIWLLIPAALSVLALLMNLATNDIFYIAPLDGVNVYFRGPLFPYLYAGPAFYLTVTFFLTWSFRATLERRQISTIRRLILIIGGATLLQYVFPEYLLTGVAMAMAIVMMFFVVQNPDDMLDLISGVFNYDALMLYLDARISQSAPLRFLAVDVGGIRRVNSAFGLIVGNRVFSQIGGFLNGLDDGIWVFRMIGTRFMVITTTEEQLLQIVNKVSLRFKQPWEVDGNSLNLSATIRYYSAANAFTSAEEVIGLVDSAYAGLDAGSWGHHRLINKDVLDISRRRTLIEDAVRDALRTGAGFSLDYQPLYNVKESAFTRAEALLRLDSTLLGRISPEEFIPIAEKSGLILQIDDYVIKAACKFLARNPGLEALEINLSAAEFFRDPTVRIDGIVRSCGVDPKRVCFEVTETAAINSPDVLSDFMTSMIALGYQFALDDFGTGYANITQVANLPFAIAKLDKILLAHDEKTMILFDSVGDMFANLGISTVVEGVETPEQSSRALARADFIQGFFYARPMPEFSFVNFLKNQPNFTK